MAHKLDHVWLYLIHYTTIILQKNNICALIVYQLFTINIAIHFCTHPRRFPGVSWERLYMHQDRGIVHMYIWSDSISMRPDNPNTLLIQSTNMNDAPREPFRAPVIWNPIHGLDLWTCIQSHAMSWSSQALRHCINRTPIDVLFIQHNYCHWHCKFRFGHQLWLDSAHRSRIDLTHRFQFDLTHRFWLDLTHQSWLDSTNWSWLYLNCWFHLDWNYRFWLGLTHRF